jgi:hypothetical protein
MKPANEFLHPLPNLLFFIEPHQTGDLETKSLWRKRFNDTKFTLNALENENFVHFLGI